MLSRRLVAVWLGVGLCSACGVPIEPIEPSEQADEEWNDEEWNEWDEAPDPDAAADAAGAALAAACGPLAQRAYIKASNPGAFDYFGSVALSADGSTLVVGAPGESSAATGAGGDQTDDSAPSAGAVYVFQRHGKTWRQQAYLKASNTDAYDELGAVVALSADGSTLAVGAVGEASAATGIGGDQADDSAPYAGAVYIFQRRGKTWRQQAYLKASNTDAYDWFGSALALSADGSTLAVGASNEASAATGVDGDQADDSALSAGAVYVFRRHGKAWSQQAYVKASNTDALDRFGHRVALSADGSLLAVSARLESSAATGVGGDQADNSAPYAGAVYVLARTGATWSHQAYVKASNTDAYDGFGFELALAADGSRLAVGVIDEGSAATGVGGDQADDSAARAGAVYVFARSGTAWHQEAYVKASNTDAGDLFGGSIALSADGATLAVSAIGEDSAATGIGGDQTDDTAEFAGAVYVLARTGATWSHQAYVKASNTDAYDIFGTDVALSADGASLAVGAPQERSAAAGIGGDQTDDSMLYPGAVYVFDRRP